MIYSISNQVNKNSLLSCVFIVIALIAVAFDYGKILAIKKWGAESEGQVVHFNYDCSRGVPTKREAPTLIVEYGIFGQSREYKTEWWIASDKGYCLLKLGAKIKMLSIGFQVGQSNFIFSASEYELDESNSRIVTLWAGLIVFFIAIGAEFKSRIKRANA